MILHFITKKIAILVGMTIFLLCTMFTTGQVFAAGMGGFSDSDTTESDVSNWMRDVVDTQTLSQLSIPGTHDSMSLYGNSIFDASVVKTQSMPLNTQLKAGIRYLDIRVKRTGSSFDIYHGSVYQKASFDDALSTVTTFLKNHPSETILMRVKEETDAASGSQSFETIFQNYWNKYSAYLVKPTSNNPKLGDVRGKIVILQDFSATQNFGIPYYSLNIQDNFTDMGEAKANAIEQHLLQANKDTSHMYLNHFSANGVKDAGTYLTQDNKTPKAIAKDINTGFWAYLQLPANYNAKHPEYIEHTGIIAMDFPSSGKTSTPHISDYPVLKDIGINDIIISKNEFVPGTSMSELRLAIYTFMFGKRYVGDLTLLNDSSKLTSE
ncbi:phosphatidylinositol-specific phospholipase C [Bacillus toyonensis]|uniref:phosphatidylinositol-specific phospholipase C n=1 Tax=Bacillus toyonensis TaxID=155322 RepID=UPI0021B398B1|nr:phosphatidylinositol-specific phospholipase C [Bacillus toyonensis]